MRRLISFLRANYRLFSQHWSVYLLLLVGTNLMIGSVVAPLLTWLVERLMAFNGVTYLTYTNIGPVMLHHPLLLVSLLIILALICAAVYLQMTFLLRSMCHIQKQTQETYWTIFTETVRGLVALRPTTMLAGLLYFLLILPFGQVLFKPVLLSKVTVPAFIIQDMWSSPKIWVPIILVYVSALVLSIRLITFLPETIAHPKAKLRTTLKRCWQATQHQAWRIFLKGSVLTTSVVLVGVGFRLILFISQEYYDQHLPHQALFLAILNLFMLEIVSQILLALTVVLVLQVVLNQYGEVPAMATVVRQAKVKKRTKLTILRQIVTIGLIVTVAGSVALYNYVYLEGMLDDQPALISHRGVDDGNGVQNTIPALEKTAQEKPDYVEMDVHETKDQQFVVMHDDNLNHLAGVDRDVHDMTLAELTALTVRENGHSAKVASFDQYLAAAEKQHQKLLVEIKTTNEDSPQMVQHFIDKCEKRLLKDHSRIHSLSYPIVAEIKQKAPELFVSFILPYNITFPQTPANGYTMEATTLNATFVDQAHSKGQTVYAWTVNDEDVMQRMLFTSVDGIITDQLATLKEVVKENNDHPSYATRLSIYANQLAGFNGDAEN
ncbi:glycerophosphoryl diester phosphodiesterase membrane domain-containing protein [Latilactobacillus fragifolii]|uniref:glycerophosphoryl diester phosphodiesterase membrane domain-containing protein n=1 Tax=Latilactobacillus fragifolii TaxID=2814244 RepID=UPI001ABA9E6B|nr:glycerophosphodiester phosphodiesterase [Latilactobacillus fragifolii]